MVARRADAREKRANVSRRLCSLLSGLLLIGVGMHFTSGQGRTASDDQLEVSLSRIARVTGDINGDYEFFRLDASPDDARRVLVCSLHLSALTNEESAEVFSSADGGETWSLRFRDSSSHDVSEDACAFGEGGAAYFIAQPWNVKAPHAPHVSIEQSEMHLYRSSDYGENWPALLTADFVDYARIAVDTRGKSPFRGRAYIVGNRTAREEFPLLAVLENGKWLIEAQQSRGLAGIAGRHGQYPRSLVVLRNGDVLASYDFLHDGRVGPAVTATRDGGRTLDGPVSIDAAACPQGSPSIAENPETGLVFAFYARKAGTSCVPAIATSTDKGRTWERSSISLPDLVNFPADEDITPRSITFRNDGVCLLTWTARAVLGAVFAPDWRLLWSGEISTRDLSSGANLAPYVRRDDRPPGEADSDMDVSLQFAFSATRNVETAVRADSSFVVVWREQDGQLYSRSVCVAPRRALNTVSNLPGTDVTSLVRYEAENITFDENSNLFEYNLSLVNASETTLQGPLVFRLNRVATTVGSVTLKDLSGDRIVFIPKNSSTLQAGEKTLPTHIRVQTSPGWRDSVVSTSHHFPRVGLIGRVYAEVLNPRK